MPVFHEVLISSALIPEADRDCTRVREYGQQLQDRKRHTATERESYLYLDLKSKWLSLVVQDGGSNERCTNLKNRLLVNYLCMVHRRRDRYRLSLMITGLLRVDCSLHWPPLSLL